MRLPRFFTVAVTVFLCGRIFASDNDSTAATSPPDTVVQSDTVAQPATITPVDSLSAADAYAAFSVRQKKHLKTAIICNAIYAGGMGLLYGVVVPRTAEAETTTDQLKLLPLSLLSAAMMYASLPISIVNSHRAKKNYAYYYKTAPRNITLPLTFTGVGCLLGASTVSVYTTINDYRDNDEIDGSYDKYTNVITGLAITGSAIWAGTNIYALVYTIVLGEKAKRHAAPPVTLAPFRCDDANGCLLTWDF